MRAAFTSFAPMFTSFCHSHEPTISLSTMQGTESPMSLRDFGRQASLRFPLRDAHCPLVVVVTATAMAAVIAVIVIVGDGYAAAQRQQAEQGGDAGEHPRAIPRAFEHWSPPLPVRSFGTAFTLARSLHAHGPKAVCPDINGRKATRVPPQAIGKRP